MTRNMYELYELGGERGRAAAAFTTFDTEDDALALLVGRHEGDPEVCDIEPSWLSGEWAGESLTELGLADATDDELNEYENGAHDAFWDTVFDAAYAKLSDENRARFGGYPVN